MHEAATGAATAVGGNGNAQTAGALRAAAPFRDLPDAVFGAIVELAVVRNVRAGETVFTIGQYDGHEFYFVASGELKCARFDDGGEMLLQKIGRHEFFGLAAAVADAPRAEDESATLTAEAESTILCIEASAFRDVVAHRPSLSRALMLHFAREQAVASKSAVSSGAPERRIFAALLAMVERDAVSGEFRVARMPKHREIAEKAGAEEGAVANAVARLIQEGAARRDYPGLVIADMARLNRLAS